MEKEEDSSSMTPSSESPLAASSAESSRQEFNDDDLDYVLFEFDRCLGHGGYHAPSSQYHVQSDGGGRSEDHRPERGHQQTRGPGRGRGKASGVVGHSSTSPAQSIGSTTGCDHPRGHSSIMRRL